MKVISSCNPKTCINIHYSVVLYIWNTIYSLCFHIYYTELHWNITEMYHCITISLWHSLSFALLRPFLKFKHVETLVSFLSWHWGRPKVDWNYEEVKLLNVSVQLEIQVPAAFLLSIQSDLYIFQSDHRAMEKTDWAHLINSPPWHLPWP